MASIAQKKLLYNQTPKLHVLDHSCFMHGFCSLRLSWAYRWEALMAKMIACASACTRGTRSERSWKRSHGEI
eukprot:8215299-Karenia_brevis.AAC.1